MLLEQVNIAEVEWMMGAGDALESGPDSASCPSSDSQIRLVGLQVSSCDLVPIGHCTHSRHSRDN